MAEQVARRVNFSGRVLLVVAGLMAVAELTAVTPRSLAQSAPAPAHASEAHAHDQRGRGHNGDGHAHRYGAVVAGQADQWSNGCTNRKLNEAHEC